MRHEVACTGSLDVPRKPKPLPGRLTHQVVTFLRPSLFVVFSLLALVVCLSTSLAAAPQQPTGAPAVSLERIRRQVEKPPGRRLEVELPVQLPVATFKMSVTQHPLMLTFEEQLHKDFDLTSLQRQSQDWASRCCGINLVQLTNSIQKALRRREESRIRQQIARELAELEAARGK
jgi:hypothetical protein